MFFSLKKAASALSLFTLFFSSFALAKDLSVVATSFPQYDLVKHIAGDRARVSMLLKPGADAHSFEPSPKDMIAIENCSLFVYNGGENDEWIEGFLSSHDSAGAIRTFTFIKAVELLPEQMSEGMQEDADENENKEETEYDEHVFASLKNDAVIIDRLCEALSEISPENRDYFYSNAKAYKEKFLDLDRRFEQLISNAKLRTVIFADRFPLLYFARDYGLDYYAAFKGCSSDTEVSASTVRFLIDKARRLKSRVIFKIELTPDALADTVAAGSDAKVLVFNSGHNVTVEQFEKGVSLYQLYEANLEALNEALN